MEEGTVSRSASMVSLISNPPEGEIFEKKDVKQTVHIPLEVLTEIERPLLSILNDIHTTFPIDAQTLTEQLCKAMKRDSVPQEAVENLLQKFETQQMIV